MARQKQSVRFIARPFNVGLQSLQDCLTYKIYFSVEFSAIIKGINWVRTKYLLSGNRYSALITCHLSDKNVSFILASTTIIILVGVLVKIPLKLIVPNLR